MRKKYWDKEEESLLIELRELGYTYKQISIELGRSATSCARKYYRLTNPNYIEKDKQYRENNKDKIKQYYQDNRDERLEYQKHYYQDNKDKILEDKKQYYEDNKDRIAEYNKQYYEDNKDKRLEYAKQYYEDNKDRIAEYNKQYYKDNREYYKQYYQDNKDRIVEYRRNYDAQNPNKSIRKERYDGEFADIQLCHKFYNGISPITGTKDDLQVHHLISVRDNREFWELSTPEIRIKNLILIPRDLHIAYHTWMGGNKVPSTPESFWEFIDTVFSIIK